MGKKTNELNLTEQQNQDITDIYRMLCAMDNLQKKDADKIRSLFYEGGYEISKSRCMNLLSKQNNMNVNELYCFVTGLFHFYK